MSIKTLDNINMLNDAMFKAFFRSNETRNVISSFLSKLTGIDEEILRKAEYQGGELPKKRLKEKGKTSDIIIKIDDGNKIILEMNQYYSKKIFEKNTSYVFSILSETVPKGTKKYPKVILINFDNFNYFNTDKPILNFMLRDEYGHIETNRYNSIHLILENLVNQEYTISEEIKKLIRFLKMKSIEEMEEEFEGDEDYMACIRTVEELSTDPNFVGYYDIEEARRQELEDMEETGIEKGIEQGEKRKQIEIAKSMFKENLPIEIISKCTGLSIEEIKSLI